MQYQELIRILPHHYLNWSATSICPKSATWQELLEVTGGQIDVCLLPLLNLATGCLDPNEVYCEVGCNRGASLIAALGDRQDVMAYAVDDFQNSPEDAAESLLTTLEQADLSDRLLFCQQNVLEFFLDLRQLETAEKIGVLFLNVGVDYRTTLMALLLAEPFLSDRALLMVHHGIDQALMQAIQDFIAIYPQCQLLLEMSETSILSWDRHQASSQTFENIETPDNSDYHQQETDISHLYKLAISYHQQGQLDEAEAQYRQILDITENRPEVWLNFGILCYMSHHLDEALYALSRSIDLDNSRAIAYYHIGLVLEALNRGSEAIAAYRKALSLDKNYIDAYNNLGNLLFECGHFDAAEKLYREAIAIDPSFPGSYTNLSKLFLETGYIDTAAKACRDALLYAPDDEGLRASLVAIEREEKHLASVYFNAGNTFYNQRKFGEALPRYSLSLAVQSLETITYLLLASSTISCQQQGILAAWWCHRRDRYPDLALLYKSCVQALCSENCTETAMEIARSGEICFPELPIFSFFSRLALPILYEKEQDIPVYRQRFEKGLQELADAVQQLDMSDRDRLDAYEQAIGSFTNFFLSYQGKNDVDFQQQYGQIVHHLMSAKYPHLVRPLHVSSPKPEGKIRVGFVSPHMKAHSLGELYIGWLRHSDPALLEMYCYYLGEVEDSLTQEFERYSHVFRKLAGCIEAIAAQILSDELHVVIFPEIGLEATTVQLAALRLAPIQCATWIHPVTSGLPTVDYFLSSELMEPSNGREHYTETLVPLPNLGISYPKPQLPQLSKGRDFFGLCEDSVVYLACQSLMKYLPQHDGAYARILRDVPQSQIVFIAHPSDRITEQFQLRLARTFEQFGLDMRDRCIIVPRLTERDYLNLNQLSNVFLDSFSWSGGITTLKAIACGLPVVTCPGDLMRGHHSYAILQMLGITETIARTEDEYVDIAVRLGIDSGWRQQIQKQIEQQQDLLYSDRECIQAFEEFCSATIRRSSLQM